MALPTKLTEEVDSLGTMELGQEDSESGLVNQTEEAWNGLREVVIK